VQFSFVCVLPQRKKDYESPILSHEIVATIGVYASIPLSDRQAITMRTDSTDGEEIDRMKLIETNLQLRKVNDTFFMFVLSDSHFKATGLSCWHPSPKT
jgi:hypothetical protein